MKTLVTQRVARGRRTSLTDSRKTVQKTRETCPPAPKTPVASFPVTPLCVPRVSSRFSRI
jgi:hypothetical protein